MWGNYKIAPHPLPSKAIPNLLHNLSDTLQKPLQQTPPIHYKLLHKIICLVQQLFKLRIFFSQLFILIHYIFKAISESSGLLPFSFVRSSIALLYRITLFFIFIGIRITEPLSAIYFRIACLIQ